MSVVPNAAYYRCVLVLMVKVAAATRNAAVGYAETMCVRPLVAKMVSAMVMKPTSTVGVSFAGTAL